MTPRSGTRPSDGRRSLGGEFNCPENYPFVTGARARFPVRNDHPERCTNTTQRAWVRSSGGFTGGGGRGTSPPSFLVQVLRCFFHRNSKTLKIQTFNTEVQREPHPHPSPGKNFKIWYVPVRPPWTRRGPKAFFTGPGWVSVPNQSFQNREFWTRKLGFARGLDFFFVLAVKITHTRKLRNVIFFYGQFNTSF